MRTLLRVLSAACFVGLPTAALSAEPVVVPEFSFDDNSNFALSVMLQNQVTDRLLQDGHIVLNQSVVAKQVGDAAVDRCYENPGCPFGILPQLPAKVALIARIHRGGAGLMGHVELWEQSRQSPIDVRDVAILPGQETAFVDEVARATSQLLLTLPPSDNQTLMNAARLIAGQPSVGFATNPTPYPQPSFPTPVNQPYPTQPVQPYPQPGYATQPVQPYPQPGYPTQPVQPYPQPGYPAPQQPYGTQPGYPAQPYPAPVQQPYPAPAQPYPAQPYPQPTVGFGNPQPEPEPDLIIEDLDSDPEPIRSGRSRSSKGPVDPGDLRKSLEGTGVKMRHIAGAEQSLSKSDMDPRDWMYKATPHAGRFIVEARIGLGMGDVDRQADVRVEVDGNVQTPNAYFLESPRAASSVRGGVFVGYAPIAFFDFGASFGLQYGKRHFSTGIHQLEDASVIVSDVQVVPAAQIVVQPRLRAYVIPTGIVKPFVVVGGDIRLFDAYKIVQPQNVVYPVPVGGTVPGVLGGGGLMVDPSPIIGIFAEGTYIKHFGGRAGPGQRIYDTWVHETPIAPKHNTSTIAFVVGAQFRL